MTPTTFISILPSTIKGIGNYLIYPAQNHFNSTKYD